MSGIQRKRVDLRRELKRLMTLGQILWTYKRREVVCSSLPVRLWIEPTNACNLKCIMCPRGMPGYSRGYMDINLFKRIMDEAKSFVYSIFLCLGGEPLLHPELATMVRYAKSVGISSRLFTNATLLTRERVTALLQAGLDYISFSFDGYDKKTYEKIRVGANFEKTLSNIIAFLKLKQELGLNKPYATLQALEFDESFTKMDAAKRKVFQKGFEGLPLNKFDIIKPHNWGGKLSGIGDASYGLKGKYSPCLFIWYSLAVLWDGTIVPCCRDLFGDYPLGHIDTTGLIGAWNGDRMVTLRRKIAAGNYGDVDLCADCDVLWRRRLFGVPNKRLGDILSFIKGP